MPDDERIPVWLTREQLTAAEIALDHELRRCRSVEWCTDVQNARAAIAEQVRAQDAGEASMLTHPMSCRCAECEPDYA